MKLFERLKLENIKNIRFISFVKILILFSFFLVLNSNALNNSFTMDDEVLITTSYLTKNLKFIPAVFGKALFGSGRFYRPLLQIFLMFEYAFFKTNPFGYHFVNILLHFINSLLFFKILNLLFGDKKLSFLASFLFAVHPINNFVVNICVASDLFLSSIFMSLTIIYLIKFSTTDNKKFYYSSILFFVIALLFRETAILLPFYLLCFMFYCYKKEGLRKHLYLILSFFVYSFIYLLLRFCFSSLEGFIFNEFAKSFSVLDYILGFSRLMLLYFHSIIIPENIFWIWNIDPELGFSGIESLIFFLSFLILFYVLVKFWRNKKVSFCLFWFLIGALPILLAMGIRYDFGFILEPYWLYFSSISIFLLISLFLISLKNHVNFKLWICMVLTILLFYCLEARKQNYLWKEPKIYYQHWLNKFPNNIARFNLGNIYFANGQDAEGEQLYKETMSHNIIEKGDLIYYSPGNISLHYLNKGLFYYSQNKLAEALEMFNQTIKMNPKNSMVYFYRACVFLKKNQTDLALLDLEKSVEIDPYNLDAHYNLAVLYAKLGKDDKALEEYYKAINLDKNSFGFR